MKYFARSLQLIIGGLFIFSGVVKLNDPVGFELKLEEYFEVFSQDLPVFKSFFDFLGSLSLYLSIAICAFEVIFGVALLVGYRIKRTLYLFLILIIFFTFLTFYSAYFNKVTDCGCFGDFLHLRPWVSFQKDLFFALGLLFLIWNIKYLYRIPGASFFTFLTILASISFGIYSYFYLPIWDFLPYKIGENIPKNMKPSEPPKFEYVLEKDKKIQTFIEYPKDTTWKFKSMKELNPEAHPKITDYRIFKDSIDFTSESFKGKKFFVIIPAIEKTNTTALKKINSFAKKHKSSADFYILTASNEETLKTILELNQIQLSYYFADMKVLKTIHRANPGLWYLEDGVVKGKWHFNQLEEIQLN